MATHVLCVFLITFQVVCSSSSSEQYRNDGLLDRMTSGMKFAQNLLGSESVALKVAEFVVRAFQTANKPSTSNRRWPNNDLHKDETSYSESESHAQEQEKGPDYDVSETLSPLAPLRQIVRLFGLQPNQISAVAVNALVFVAQMISTFLSGPRRPSRPGYKSEDPSEWILNKNNRKLQELIAAAKNESLPDTINEIIKEQGSKEETSCIRLLVCKVTPFITRMQKTVFGQEENKSDERFSKELHGSAIMYRHLPSAEEINARSDICEQQHRDCNLKE